VFKFKLIYIKRIKKKNVCSENYKLLQKVLYKIYIKNEDVFPVIVSIAYNTSWPFKKTPEA
jgi:hypothetical protein